jgi:hypothetical protein
MSAHDKLMQARIKLQSADLKKTGENKFAGYKYFELGDFLPAVQTIFAELKLCGVVSYGIDLATLTITDLEDNSSIFITSPMSTAALKGCHEVQNLGAVQTYIRRYLWVAAMEIVEHDALDATTGKEEPRRDTRPRSIQNTDAPKPQFTEAQLTAIQVAVDSAIDAFNAGNVAAAHEFIYGMNDNEKILEAWDRLKPYSTMRSAIKRYREANVTNQQKEAA